MKAKSLFMLATMLGFLVPGLMAAMPAQATDHEDIPAFITKAMADPARAADSKNDKRRKMAQVVAFTGVKPGMKVLELMPGTGYWTRVFSQIVGSNGHVYQWWPDWPPATAKYEAKHVAQWRKLAATKHYANVSVLQEPSQVVWAPGSVDVVFTCDNYHDLHNADLGPVDMHRFDQQVYQALKPGGVFIVIDHRAPAGSGTSDTDTLHRIDPASVKKEVEAVGFQFAGASNALANPKDPLTIPVFDKSIRGHTSQFNFRFRKPQG